MLTNENRSYSLTFEALELLAACQNIDMRGLHHRYHASTAAAVLITEAAKRLRDARAIDKATARKVWKRHRPQTSK